jgi:hypothetical protein
MQLQSDWSRPLPQTIVIPTPMQLWTAPRQLLTFARWGIVIACYAFRGDAPWGTTLR